MEAIGFPTFGLLLYGDFYTGSCFEIFFSGFGSFWRQPEESLISWSTVALKAKPQNILIRKKRLNKDPGFLNQSSDIRCFLLKGL